MSWKFSVRRSPLYSSCLYGRIRRRLLDRRDFDDVLVVGLIGELFEVARGIDARSGYRR